MNAADPCLIEAEQVLEKADLMYSAKQIDQAISQLAERINRQFANTSQAVIVIPIMNGGLILSGHLISRLEFPLLVDYLHATRYRNETSGADLQWIAKPQLDLKDRIILIIDDILDEGHTLNEVLDFCAAQGAEQAHSVVLVEKDHGREVARKADFTGLYVADRYVFGFGMDYKGYHRNLKCIYAVNQAQSQVMSGEGI